MNKKYNWIKWFRRKRFTLKRGTDFECMPHSMAQQVRNAAYRFRKIVNTRIREDTLEVTVNDDLRRA